MLIEDVGTAARKLPQGKPAGAAKGARAIRGGGDESSPSYELLGGGLLSLLVMWAGALRERRGVRLRIA